MKAIIFAVLISCSVCFAQSPPKLGGLSPQEQAQIRSLTSRIRANLTVEETVPNSAEAEVEINYDENGYVTSLTFLHPSGFDAYDIAIRQAILNAAPFLLTPHTGHDGKPVRRIVIHFRKGLLPN